MTADLNAELKRRREKLIRRNERYARWSRRWAEILVTGLLIYVTLPFVAPTLMKLGAPNAAGIIYNMYSPLCHQFAFRSMFLYGEQVFYPRSTAEVDSLESFDERAAQSETFVNLYTERRRNQLQRTQSQDVADNYQFGGAEELSHWDTVLMSAARSFRGDEKMGYKVALCARDIAIYGAMVIGGIIFLFVRHRLRPVPLALYVLLGLGPIALDGFSQLLSYPPFELWQARESIPELRMLTGAIFGFMNVWLAFPYLEQSMLESARNMEATIATIQAEDRA
jgi:uncharacterized membrane protein